MAKRMLVDGIPGPAAQKTTLNRTTSRRRFMNAANLASLVTDAVVKLGSDTVGLTVRVPGRLSIMPDIEWDDLT